jgi:ribosomal protein L30/L7E
MGRVRELKRTPMIEGMIRRLPHLVEVIPDERAKD